MALVNIGSDRRYHNTCTQEDLRYTVEYPSTALKTEDTISAWNGASAWPHCMYCTPYFHGSPRSQPRLVSLVPLSCTLHNNSVSCGRKSILLYRQAYIRSFFKSRDILNHLERIR